MTLTISSDRLIFWICQFDVQGFFKLQITIPITGENKVIIFRREGECTFPRMWLEIRTLRIS